MDGQIQPGGWTLHGHLDSSHLARHTDSALQPSQPLHNTPKLLFTLKAPLRNQQGQTLSLGPSNPSVRLSQPHLCLDSVHQSCLTPISLGEGEKSKALPWPSSGTSGSLWGALARLPTPTSILGHQQHLLVPVLPQNRLCSTSHPQSGGAG